MHCRPEVPQPSGAGNLPDCHPAAAADEVAALRPIRSILGRTDYWRLNEHRRRAESLGSPLLMRLARLIRAKMLDAAILDPDQLPPDVVTGTSCVTFAIGQRRPETRILYHFDYADRRRNQLHVGTFAGVTLIGMRVGQRMRLLDGSGVAGEIRVLAVGPDSATAGPASG
ncbi:hypothetical protein [Tabrizicola soli]|uniref:Transcription elongation factor GreA/GreB C-terminal domain-containing protein n=1 Tax=Tabrizicola soli TaxID=2185115 RepID=A0ABV7DV25_9RHOB|nr:hypothetical protein [Tabrizicola soli]